MTAAPCLDGPGRAAFDRWLAANVERFVPRLSFAEIRKGVRALSALYVEGREAGDLAQRALSGEGKRAAFATYYAALHFLTTAHALGAPGLASLRSARTVVDVGCGTGAVGAAVALSCRRPPRLVLADRSGWATGEARQTLSLLGLAGRARRAALPAALPAGRPGAVLCLGWVVNELDAGTRAATFQRVDRFLARGGRLLLLEPLARPVSPWWETWRAALAPRGVAAHELRVAVERPDFVAAMDRAAGLDHRTLGARLLAGPL